MKKQVDASSYTTSRDTTLGENVVLEQACIANPTALSRFRMWHVLFEHKISKAGHILGPVPLEFWVTAIVDNIFHLRSRISGVGKRYIFKRSDACKPNTFRSVTVTEIISCLPARTQFKDKARHFRIEEVHRTARWDHICQVVNKVGGEACAGHLDRPLSCSHL